MSSEYRTIGNSRTFLDNIPNNIDALIRSARYMANEGYVDLAESTCKLAVELIDQIITPYDVDRAFDLYELAEIYFRFGCLDEPESLTYRAWQIFARVIGSQGVLTREMEAFLDHIHKMKEKSQCHTGEQG